MFCRVWTAKVSKMLMRTTVLNATTTHGDSKQKVKAFGHSDCDNFNCRLSIGGP